MNSKAKQTAREAGFLTRDELFGQTATSATPESAEPLTIDKLREAMQRVGLPQTFEVSKDTDLVSRLNLMDAGSYVTSDPFGTEGCKSIHGITVKTSPVVPKDVLVFKQAGEVVKVIPLTKDAEGPARAFAAAVEAAKQGAYRGILKDMSNVT